MFLAAGQQYEISPQEYLRQNLVSSRLLPLLLYVPLALTLGVVGGHAIFEALSSTSVGKCCLEGRSCRAWGAASR